MEIDESFFVAKDVLFCCFLFFVDSEGFFEKFRWK